MRKPAPDDNLAAIFMQNRTIGIKRPDSEPTCQSRTPSEYGA